MAPDDDTTPGVPQPAANQPSPYSEAEKREMALKLRQALRLLPPSQRTVMRLELAGLSPDEVAEVMGLKRDAEYHIRRRALEALRSLLPACLLIPLAIARARIRARATSGATATAKALEMAYLECYTLMAMAHVLKADAKDLCCWIRSGREGLDAEVNAKERKLIREQVYRRRRDRALELFDAGLQQLAGSDSGHQDVLACQLDPRRSTSTAMRKANLKKDEACGLLPEAIEALRQVVSPADFEQIDTEVLRHRCLMVPSYQDADRLQQPPGAAAAQAGSGS